MTGERRPTAVRERIDEWADRHRWPRRRTRLPGRRRLEELAGDPLATVRRANPVRLRRIGRLGDDERLIGLMLIRDEDDIVEEMLRTAVQWFDRILVLDGTVAPERRTRTDEILASFPEVVWHGRDEDHFPGGVRDGARQVLLDEARRRYGVDNWIGVLHADEFLDQDPRPMLAAHHPSLHPSIRVRVTHAFLHADDEAAWRDETPLRIRVGHVMWPGVPEARFFFDDGSRRYDPDLHSKVLPRSFRNGPLVDGYVIVQYNERSPAQVIERARQRAAGGWQLGHYARFLTEPPRVFVETLDLESAPFAPEFAGDPEGPFRPCRVDDLPLRPGRVPFAIRSADATPVPDGAAPRDLALVVGPHGLLELARRPSKARAAAWASRAGRPGAMGHAGLVTGQRALVRYVAQTLGCGRRLTYDQRRTVAATFVHLLAGAQCDQAGWFATPGPAEGSDISALLETRA